MQRFFHGELSIDYTAGREESMIDVNSKMVLLVLVFSSWT